METLTNDNATNRAFKRIKPEPSMENERRGKIDTVSEADIKELASKTESLRVDVQKGQNLSFAASKDLPIEACWDQTRLDLDGATNLSSNTQCRVVFLGASGVGKSSVINALIDQADLLPSSGTGDACTAVPIEVHHNGDPQHPELKAQIQYITRAEWCSVIEQAKAEIGSEEDDDATDHSNGALQRLTEVYPLLSMQAIGSMSAEEIIDSNKSARYLGTCVDLQVSDRVKFSKDFKQQIGSLKRPDFATWPMIDHARLYVRHHLLENGLILVDIPGMFETNRARVENAAAYLRKCSAVCIMSRASRSVADGQQQSLFNRALDQIQYDQRLDSVLLVCTKSDEVVLRETATELEIPEAQAQQLQLVRAKADQLKIESAVEALKKQLQEQEDIVKYRELDSGRWKKAQTTYATDWDSFVAPRERLSGRKFAKAEANGEIWSEQDVVSKISNLKEEKIAAAGRCKQFKISLAKKTTQLNACKEDIKILTLRTKKAVFKARNDLIKDKQADVYLDTVTKFNKQTSMAANRVSNLTDNPKDQSASLSDVKDRIYCVSALAYSHLSGLKTQSSNDIAETVDDVSKYADVVSCVEDTEIPALAKRLRHVALTERYHKLSKIELKIRIALGSLRGRLSPRIQQHPVNLGDAESAMSSFAGSITEFSKTFGGPSVANAGVIKLYKDRFTDKVIDLRSSVVKRATEKIGIYATHPGNGANPKALWPGEFKAAVHPVRTGFYQLKRVVDNGNKLTVNFNATVARAIKFYTAKLTANVLVSKDGEIKQALEAAYQKLASALDVLHHEFRKFAVMAGVPVHRINIAGEQLALRQRYLELSFRNAAEQISQCHVDAAGSLAKDIESGLTPAYSRAYRLTGAGARQAMADELTAALNDDDVIKHTLTKFHLHIGDDLGNILGALSGELTLASLSITADYNSYMDDRAQTTESTGDPGLDRIRSQMIAHGYDDLRIGVSDNMQNKSIGNDTDEIKMEIGEIS